MLATTANSLQRPYTAVFIVPTGIGAAIGGYAGDALPVVRALASVCDRVVTHPNVLNGAQLYWPLPNVLYVEGYGLDRFAAGDWGLRPVRQNRIGLVLDSAMEPELRLRHLQAADAARATLGLEIADWVLTDRPLQVELRQAASGTSWGTIGEPGSLLRAAETLRDTAGVNAIAVVARFPDEDPAATNLQQYRAGCGVDPIAGAEAVISHLVVRHLGLPCAHAPALSPLPVDPTVSPRAAAEELGYTFLPCVLVGLARAPQFAIGPGSETASEVAGESLWARDVNALVIPETACGGSAMLSLTQAKIVTVAENATQLQVTPEMLNLRVCRARSYAEALGLLAADRAGVALEALRPQLSSLQSRGRTSRAARTVAPANSAGHGTDCRTAAGNC